MLIIYGCWWVDAGKPFGMRNVCMYLYMLCVCVYIYLYVYFYVCMPVVYTNMNIAWGLKFCNDFAHFSHKTFTNKFIIYVGMCVCKYIYMCIQLYIHTYKILILLHPTICRALTAIKRNTFLQAYINVLKIHVYK